MLRKTRPVALGVSALLYSLFHPGFAQTVPADDEAHRLGEVTVSATRTERKVDNVPNICSVYTRQDLPASPELAELADRSVLCVGGRQGVVPIYRQLIERTGGRLLHHDGGEEAAVTKLDASLAAADLVICQTGCISHDAYWRVKDHCKRHGKRCVFVDKSSASSLQRALDSISSSTDHLA